MNDDLTDIALTALEQAEANDANSDEADTSKDESDEEETSEEADDESETEQEESQDDSEEEDEGEESEDESEEESKEEKKEEKKELSDEEFEELAKKRGYAKRDLDAERRQEAQNNARTIESMPKPKELDADTWAAMPAINKVIYNNLPYITAQGKDGQTIKVKTPQQLPKDFEFANDTARADFMAAIQAQESKANAIEYSIKSRAQAQRQQERSQAEARDMVAQVDALQKSGDLPKPKAEPNSPEFNNDPAVKLIDKVLSYRQSRAAQGVNLSVKDALTLYKAEHPADFRTGEAKGDAERKKISKKINGGKKSSDAKADNVGYQKRYYKFGMSTQDVLDRALEDLD
jgi:hypothetical protein